MPKCRRSRERSHRSSVPGAEPQPLLLDGPGDRQLDDLAAGRAAPSRRKGQRPGDCARRRAECRVAWNAIAEARLLLSTDAGAWWAPMARPRTPGPRSRGQSALAGSEQAHDRLGLPLARQSERLAAPLELGVARRRGQWTPALVPRAGASGVPSEDPLRRLRRHVQHGRRCQARLARAACFCASMPDLRQARGPR
jgi:hypothetical protein